LDIIIRHIIDIDKRANEIIDRTRKYIEDSERDTKDRINKMKTDIINEAKNKAKELYESAINEAKLEAEKIRVSSKEECADIESRFLSLRETLEEKILYQIIKQI